MAASVQELLQPQVIIEVISRIREGQGRIGRWLGWHPNYYNKENVSLEGPNTVPGKTRHVTYRIDDATRVIAKARVPGTGPATVPPNPIGDVTVTCARFHEKLPLDYEFLGNLSPIMGPNAQVDTQGQDYITRQERKIAMKFNNAVELMATGMMQDNLWFVKSGDNLLPQIGDPGSGVRFQVNFQVPAGNKNQLNMLGSGNIIDVPWNNPAAPIFSHLMSIEAAFAQLSGWPLTTVWVNSLLWVSIITNTQIRNLAGSSMTPFAEFDNVAETGPDGMPTGEFEAVLRAAPTIKFKINNEVKVTGSDIDPTYATAPAGATFIKMVPDNMAFFSTGASGLWQKLYHGAEYVVENPGAYPVLRAGYYFWHERTTQPAMCELIGLLNCVPTLFVPKVLAPGVVIF